MSKVINETRLWINIEVVIKTIIYDDFIQRVNVAIFASEIRIRSRKKNFYRWNVLSQKAHLLQKNLSKLSIDIYIQIINELEIFLETVSKDSHYSSISNAIV